MSFPSNETGYGFQRPFSGEYNVSGNFTPLPNGTFQAGAGQIQYGDSTTTKAVKTLAFCLILLASIIGNPLLIASVYKNVNRRMRTASNYFVVNLAIADFLVTAIHIPRMITFVHVGYEWLITGTFGLILCKLVNFVPEFCMFVSTQSFLVIAVDRFLAVFYPIRRPLQGKVARFVIALTWLTSIAFLYVYFHYRVLRLFNGKSYCILNIIPVLFTKEDFVLFTWILFALVIGLPMFTTSGLYTAVAVKLWRTKTPGHVTAANEARRERTNRKVVKMMVSAVGIFCIGCLPNWILQIVCSVSPTLKLCFMEELVFFKNFMLCSNCALRPFIYPIFSQNFRTGFTNIVFSTFCCSRINAQQVFPHDERSERTNTFTLRTIRSRAAVSEA